MFQTKVVEKIKTHIFGSVNLFFEYRTVYEVIWKNIVVLGGGHTLQYGACALHAG
jgi:hypothetical protein